MQKIFSFSYSKLKQIYVHYIKVMLYDSQSNSV
jgi:hypothetical protein